MSVAEAAGGPADRSAITDWRRGKSPNSGEPSFEHIFAAIWAVPSTGRGPDAREPDKGVNNPLYEYGMARKAILEQIAEGNRPSEEMVNRGRQLFILAFVDHFENCINAINRALRLFERMKSETVLSGVPRQLRRALDADSLNALAAAAFAVEAMALHRSGDAEGARRSLTEAKKLIDEKLLLLEAGDWGEAWPEWLVAQLLYREAEGLIAGKKSEQPK